MDYLIHERYKVGHVFFDNTLKVMYLSRRQSADTFSFGETNNHVIMLLGVG